MIIGKSKAHINLRFRNLGKSNTNSKPSLFVTGLGKSETLNPKQFQISEYKTVLVI